MMSERLPKAGYSGELHIGEISISCFVLEDGRRVLSQAAMLRALDISKGSSSTPGGDRLVKFVNGKAINPFINKDILSMTTSPINFKTPSGNKAYGYEAMVLAEICDAVLKARDANALQKQQMHIAKMAEILLRGFARVGIVALVDEATGYQEVRDKLALAAILDKYILDEYREWTRQFSPDFYKEMFRLKGWPYDEKSIKRPSVIGRYTNDIVYSRLAPGVLKELERRNPATKPGQRKQRHHQWLTDNIGIPKLREHLAGVIALMKASSHWEGFYKLLDRVYVRFGSTMPMDFGEDD
jgi:hypothetical protein